MAKLSVGQAWMETNAFVKREAGLLFPVALLFVAVPFALILQMLPPELRAEMAKPANVRDLPDMSGGIALGIILAFLLSLAGTLAVYALALRPGISVAEALRRGLARLPVCVGGSFVVGMMLMVPLVVVTMLSPELAKLFVIAVAILLSIRLMTLNAVVATQDKGVVESLRLSWTMTRGHMLKLVGFGAIVMGLTMFSELVAQMMFGLVGFALGGSEGGNAGADLGTALAMGVAQLYASVMISRLYLQLVR
jgi:hypothetical protein